ncbi:hypothetical protein B0H67DRAFT_598651 [Lasiosphaeris hirsuta]|uniref:Polynucleotide 5'-hydroxyl-kinase GRC3 n=1 Tax=Lasiosphaeris hirsuta TaxID=260670 RepID=A0AA40B0R3_9PEZI|nr:hypothetical protein B0H67DRAFT_598651 [Lasiosphaeris hirsuta]
MSAFANRQKLWGAPSPTPSSLPDSPREELETVPRRGRSAANPLTEPLSTPVKPLTSPAKAQSGEDSNSPRKVSQHSTFRPNKKNYKQKANGRVLVHAGEGERLVILGSYGIKIREGEVTIAGAVLSPLNTLQWVHAPYSHSLPVLRITTNTIMELHPHPGAQSLRQLAKLSLVFGKLWDEPQEGISNKATFQLILDSEDGPRRALLQNLVSPAEWNKKLAGLVSAKEKGAVPIVFMCGPKSSGKSTFGRLLANRLVTDQGDSKKKAWSPVAVLDLDPGQPEYSPPGVISLNKISSPNLSPSFCHSTLEPTKGQLRAHAVASISPAQDPEHYIECVLDLYSQWRMALGGKYPLIINTPGWIQGTGLDILGELIKEIRPTEVIYMSHDGPDETVDSLKVACLRNGAANIPFHILPSQTSEASAARSSQHLRTMQTMAYFHLNWSSLATQHQTWNPTPITALRPWRVRYRGPGRGFVGILCYDHQPGPDLLGEAINGMILALVKIENKAAFRDLVGEGSTESGVAYTAEGIPLIENPHGSTLNPHHSRALGLVLVRGIDAQRGELQILTPLAGDVVAEVGGGLVLVAGKFDTPNWAYAEDLHLRTSTSAATAAAVAAPGQGVPGLAENEGEAGEFEGEELQVGEEALQEEVRAGLESHTEVPWVEMLHDRQKRSAGSKVWRTRRDLGRGGG